MKISRMVAHQRQFSTGLAGFAGLLFFHSAAQALEVRHDSVARHNRLIDFPGAPIYAQTPKPNPTFSPPATLFLGIGWPAHPTDWTRQMALVSPRHFVYATHYPLGANWQIAFLGKDGKQHSFRIQKQSPVINPKGEQTDLMLCTLASAVPASFGITPFPVLNLTTERKYIGKEMVVFGSFVKAGNMRINGFTTLTNDPGFDTTRFAYFDYNKTLGGENDCNYQGGDSGAPSFIMVDGQPALIGTASGQDELPNHISRNYLNFIPAYLPELDSLMEKEGYHVKRFYPAPALIKTKASASEPLFAMKKGILKLATRNSAASMAHNVSLKLTFSIAPSKVSGNGWICKAVSPRVWTCRRGGIPRAARSTVTATWATLPNTTTLKVTTITSCDGGAAVTSHTTLPVSHDSTFPPESASPERLGP